jgi:Na+-driven multidrug efflux pump
MFIISIGAYHFAGVAASTRVGNAIGRRDAAGAKFTGHISALLSVITGTIVMLSLLLAKDVRPRQLLPTQSIS